MFLNKIKRLKRKQKLPSTIDNSLEQSLKKLQNMRNDMHELKEGIQHLVWDIKESGIEDEGLQKEVAGLEKLIENME